MNNGKSNPTLFPVFVGDANSSDQLRTIKKLLLSTTLLEYNKIDPLVIYLNVLNFVKPGVIQEDFLGLLENYNYDVKPSDFDDYLKEKYQSKKLYFSRVHNEGPSCICKDFDDLSEYDDMTIQHVMGLFGMITCFIGWQIKDTAKFEVLVKKWMSLFSMASCANPENEGYWKLKPSPAFASALHESVALTEFRPEIISHIKKMMEGNIKLYSNPLKHTWRILAGAGLIDFISVAWHITNKHRKLYGSARPKNLIPDVINAIQKYEELGAHCVLLCLPDELTKFKNMTSLRSYLEESCQPVTIFGIADAKIPNTLNILSQNSFAGSGQRNKNQKQLAKPKAQSVSHNLQNDSVNDKQHVETKVTAGSTATTVPLLSEATNVNSSFGFLGNRRENSSLFGSSFSNNQASIFSTPSTTAPIVSTSSSTGASPKFAQSAGHQLPAANCTLQNNVSEIVTLGENASGVSCGVAEPEQSKSCSQSSEEENVSLTFTNGDIDELSEYSGLIDEIVKIQDYNKWFKAYNPVTITCLNTNYY